MEHSFFPEKIFYSFLKKSYFSSCPFLSIVLDFSISTRKNLAFSIKFFQ